MWSPRTSLPRHPTTNICGSTRSHRQFITFILEISLLCILFMTRNLALISQLLLFHNDIQHTLIVNGATT